VKVVVEIVSGARAGRRLEFDDPTVLRFGRHPSNEVAFDPEADRDASSRHAELRREGDGLFVYDLKSANGTRIGGLAAADRTFIPPGTELEFGDGGPRCRIVYDAPGGATVPPTMFKKGPPPALPIGTKVGARTVALMIDQAMARVKGTSRRLQWIAVGLGVALFLTLAGVVVAYRFRPPADVALRREMVKVMEQQRSAAASERAELQKRLDELGAKLAHAKGGGGADVARGNHDAIFLVTVRTDLQEEGFCSAFAVQANRLVTNAHCVVAAEDYRKRSGQIWVIQNGHPEVRFRVERMKRVSGFAPGGAAISPDVGWLRVAGDKPLPKLVTLAPATEYQAIATGDPMFTYGFPGRLADVTAPEATFVEGVVGRITSLDGHTGDMREARLIQHSAFTSGGTSGSPIFNAVGHVVAVNTGGYAEQSEGAGKAVVSRSLPGYNFGMRIDLVEELLREADE
jgi:S1-C subfamily serine protease